MPGLLMDGCLSVYFVPVNGPYFSVSLYVLRFFVVAAGNGYHCFVTLEIRIFF